PDGAQQVEPVAADHAFDASGRPAEALHGGGQIRPFAGGAKPRRVDDIAEIGQAAGVALVVGDPVEEWLAIALREVGTDTDIALAANVDGVVDRLNVVV